MQYIQHCDKIKGNETADKATKLAIGMSGMTTNRLSIQRQ